MEDLRDEQEISLISVIIISGIKKIFNIGHNDELCFNRLLQQSFSYPFKP